jgi:hypothetical protein
MPEHGAKLVLYLNGIAKLLFNRIDASLRNISPDTQNIRKIRNHYRTHLASPQSRLSSILANLSLLGAHYSIGDLMKHQCRPTWHGLCDVRKERTMRF